MRAGLLAASCSALLLLSACGGVSRHCVGELDYQTAQTLPPPGQVDNLTVPESPSALRIPPPPQDPVPFAREVADPENPAKTRVDCLDIPPPLVAQPEPPEG